MSLSPKESETLRLSLVETFLKSASRRGAICGIAEGADNDVIIIAAAVLPDQQVKEIKAHAREILGRDPQKTELSLVGPYAPGEAKPL